MLTQSEPVLTWSGWISILSRNFDMDVEKLHRREYLRYAVDGGVANAVFDGAPEGFEVPKPNSMTLIDISPTGIMARAFMEYECKTTAMLELFFANEHCRARGRVAHCTRTLGGFKIGFELLFDDGPPKA